jgi:acyl-CoA thioesterase-2
MLDSLDALLHALRLEPRGDDRFAVLGEPGRFDRVFGGQTVAQALLAASATVNGKAPHSLHAYFVEAGTPEKPLELAAGCATAVRCRRGVSPSNRASGRFSS